MISLNNLGGFTVYLAFIRIGPNLNGMEAREKVISCRSLRHEYGGIDLQITDLRPNYYDHSNFWYQSKKE